MRGYSWPGNIRELQNVIERAVILSDSDTLSSTEAGSFRLVNILQLHILLQKGSGDLSDLVTREIQIIESALAEAHARISGPAGAAAKLGIPRQTLESRMRKLGIRKQAL